MNPIVPADDATTNSRDRLFDSVIYEYNYNVTENLTEETRFYEDMGLDSLDRVELAMAMEDDMLVEMTQAELILADTIGKLRALVYSRLDGK